MIFACLPAYIIKLVTSDSSVFIVRIAKLSIFLYLLKQLVISWKLFEKHNAIFVVKFPRFSYGYAKIHLNNWPQHNQEL